MKSNHFPVSYIANCFTIKRMFIGRRSLSWWQLIFVMIFLMLVMMNPVALNAKSLPFMNLADVTPTLIKDLEDNPGNLKAIQQLEIKDNQLVTNQVGVTAPQVGVKLSDQEQEKLGTGLLFNQKQLILKDDNGLSFTLVYPDDIILSELTDTKQLIEQLNTIWNQQTTSYRILATVSLIGLLLVVSTLILILGSSFFIWLTRKNQFSTIRTFKESLNIVVNALFIPTVVAVLSGFILYDLTLMLTIQALGLAVVVMLIFIKTKFNDGMAKTGKMISGQP